MRRNTGLLAAIFMMGLALTAPSQVLTGKSAVEIQFPTQPGRGYQVLESSDLTNWQPVGSQIFGDGGSVSYLFPHRPRPSFFQTENFEVRNLNPLLEPVRTNRGVPALACAVVISNRIVGLGAVGLKKAGVSNAPIGLRDHWHHGSLTKSMTATLAAMMVEEGRIQWTNTLADIFPYYTNRMNSQWRSATLEQLTSNRGGAPGTIPQDTWNELQNFGGTPFDGRRLLFERMTTNVPSSAPGTRYEYSNTGFSLAGHMLETVANRPWEELLQEKLFAPLGMASAGFGVPATPRHLNHPWGHLLSQPALPPAPVANPITPIPPGPSSDNPPAIGPAGTVHCSAVDLALYCAFHMNAQNRGHPLLSQPTARKLHTAYPNNANYAHGWLVYPRDWAHGDALWHNGSNTMWMSIIWMAPNREFAMVVFCNLGGDTAAQAVEEVASLMISEFLN